ncbi:unnamed protein product [Rotaria sp. Silwood2]|nr:unnamed protein product [Rotaria sp. Silwood2]CAF4142749.1 unnamed protein product [Rotaria sp. Silwood2]
MTIFYFLDCELNAPANHLIDLTQGNEVVNIYVRDIHGCHPFLHYTIPITQSGLSFASLNARLLYQKSKCSKATQYIFVSIRILRGLTGQLIYTSDFLLLIPYYTDRTVFRIPIYRVWYWDDYNKMTLARLLS